MKPETEAWLDSLLWLAGTALKPTLPNLLNGPGMDPISPRTARRLEQNNLVSKQTNPNGDWVYQLTNHGALAALGGRIPHENWARPWDGLWRFVLFDLPRSAQNNRLQLHRWLRRNQFGNLQGSVWISPFPIPDIAAKSGIKDAGPENVIITEGTLPDRPSDQIESLVEKAWDFPDLNKKYEAYLAHVKNEPAARTDPTWRKQEYAAWRDAISADPLLPDPLLPKTYRGKDAWSERRKLIEQAGGSLDSLA
ncbi:MAG: PaaX family transcriptional regulator C-terminal domain-containing protein [Verrucomicrobiota bacterium]